MKNYLPGYDLFYRHTIVAYRQHMALNEIKERLANLVRMFRDEVNVYRSIVSDPRCPRLARWLLIAALAYAMSPIDLIPDFIPVIGHLDDIIILPFLVWLAVRIIPGELIAEHRAALKIKAEGILGSP